MKIWDQVQKSDPASIKEVSFGRKFNAINAQHQIMKATEVFGPFGDGWGVANEEYGMLFPGLLLYTADFFHGADKEHSFGISASIATHSNAGKLDDECVKKVATDALTKGLSKLGFNADVFLGLWDDNKYVNRVKEEKKAVDTTVAQAEIDVKLKELTTLSKAVLKDARLAAGEGDSEGVMALWKSYPQLHNVKGFKTAIGKHGVAAKNIKKEKDESTG